MHFEEKEKPTRERGIFFREANTFVKGRFQGIGVPVRSRMALATSDVTVVKEGQHVDSSLTFNENLV